MPDNMKVLLVGAGPVAIEYAKVLSALQMPYDVVGRGKKSAETFTAARGVPVLTLSLKDYANFHGIPAAAIVAVSMDQLADVTSRLISLGTRRILVEKPAGLNFGEVKELGRIAESAKAKVYIAYNRRFFASVLNAQELIRSDGGVRSFLFEFTEWAHTVEKLEHAPGVLNNWFFANSTHVVDMAFFLGGRPAKISTYAAGGLTWHSTAIYSGSGVSENGALFSYNANWCAPGRWSVEIMTPKHRYLFKPLEKLQVQSIGSLTTEFIEIDDSLDKEYKPGFYRQTEAFVLGKMEERLLSMAEYMDLVSVYEKMSNSEPGDRG